MAPKTLTAPRPTFASVDRRVCANYCAITLLGTENSTFFGHSGTTQWPTNESM